MTLFVLFQAAYSSSLSLFFINYIRRLIYCVIFFMQDLYFLSKHFNFLISFTFFILSLILNKPIMNLDVYIFFCHVYLWTDLPHIEGEIFLSKNSLNNYHFLSFLGIRMALYLFFWYPLVSFPPIHSCQLIFFSKLSSFRTIHIFVQTHFCSFHYQC